MASIVVCEICLKRSSSATIRSSDRVECDDCWLESTIISTEFPDLNGSSVSVMASIVVCEICLKRSSSATIRSSDRVECDDCWLESTIISTEFPDLNRSSVRHI